LVYSLVSRVLLIACIFVGSRWGAMGVAIGYSFGLLLTWPLSLIWIGKISDAPVGALFTNAMRAMTAYGIAGGCAYYASITVGGPLWEQLAVGAAAMAAVCLLALAIWPAFRRDVIAIINIRRLLMQAKARR
ncbi:polysaccharide biosynthesis protein GumJ, partial [Xanthomonas vasicola pv. musacearum NCPPB 4384]